MNSLPVSVTTLPTTVNKFLSPPFLATSRLMEHVSFPILSSQTGPLNKIQSHDDTCPRPSQSCRLFFFSPWKRRTFSCPLSYQPSTPSFSNPATITNDEAGAPWSRHHRPHAQLRRLRSLSSRQRLRSCFWGWRHRLCSRGLSAWHQLFRHLSVSKFLVSSSVWFPGNLGMGMRKGKEKEKYDVFLKVGVLSVGWLGKCVWLLMNCREGRELECFYFSFFPLFGTGECLSLHSPELNANCLDQWRWAFDFRDQENQNFRTCSVAPREILSLSKNRKNQNQNQTKPKHFWYENKFS